MKTIALIVAAHLSLFVMDDTALAAELYVAKSGNDSNAGSKEGSPVFAVGFKNFPMDQVGVKKPSLNTIPRSPSFGPKPPEEAHSSGTTQKSRSTPVGQSKHTSGKPNVILVMTDDQGWGEVGFHGNKVLKKPNPDRFAGEGTELTNFYVSPMCTPTRSSLMTGRYHFRTGAHDTATNSALPEEPATTQAEDETEREVRPAKPLMIPEVRGHFVW